MFGKPLKPGDTEKFDALVKRLWSGADPSATENRIGSGRLVWGKTARQVLNELGVPPDFEHQGLSDAGTIDWIHRTMSDGTEIYFVASRWETPESVDMLVPGFRQATGALESRNRRDARRDRIPSGKRPHDRAAGV